MSRNVGTEQLRRISTDFADFRRLKKRTGCTICENLRNLWIYVGTIDGAMIELPRHIRAQYCNATTQEVRSWSFGELKARRPPGADSKQYLRGTLYDQAIFGPIRNHEC